MACWEKGKNNHTYWSRNIWLNSKTLMIMILILFTFVVTRLNKDNPKRYNHSKMKKKHEKSRITFILFQRHEQRASLAQTATIFQPPPVEMAAIEAVRSGASQMLIPPQQRPRLCVSNGSLGRRNSSLSAWKQFVPRRAGAIVRAWIKWQSYSWEGVNWVTRVRARNVGLIIGFAVGGNPTAWGCFRKSTKC